MKRKYRLKTAKNDKLDTILIAQALIHKDEYRLVDMKTYHALELKKLTIHHHDLKEYINVYAKDFLDTISATDIRTIRKALNDQDLEYLFSSQEKY